MDASPAMHRLELQTVKSSRVSAEHEDDMSDDASERSA